MADLGGADMSIADLAETFIEINLMTPDQAHACRKLAWWLSNTTCGQLITLAEAQEMVAAETERCAAWHDREAAGAMNSLHCGSENSEYRAANRLHDFHTASAAASRAAATGTKEGDDGLLQA